MLMMICGRGLLPERRHKLEIPRASTTRTTTFDDEHGHDGTVHRPREPVGSPTPAILEAANITKRFGGLAAVNDVDFTIPEGSIVSLIGRNGAGKTTFFNCSPASTRRRPARSSSTATTSPACRRTQVTKLGIARTFQNIRLFSEHDGARERAWSASTAARTASMLGVDRCARPRPSARGGESRDKSPRAARVRRPRRARRRARQEPALRRPAAARDRARAGHGAEAAAARRAGGRHEPAGDRRRSSASSAASATSWA